MRELLGFLKEKHGSVDNYLDAIGFGKELRERVRKNICVWIKQCGYQFEWEKSLIDIVGQSTFFSKIP